MLCCIVIVVAVAVSVLIVLYLLLCVLVLRCCAFAYCCVVFCLVLCVPGEVCFSSVLVTKEPCSRPTATQGEN